MSTLFYNGFTFATGESPMLMIDHMKERFTTAWEAHTKEALKVFCELLKEAGTRYRENLLKENSPVLSVIDQFVNLQLTPIPDPILPVIMDTRAHVFYYHDEKTNTIFGKIFAPRNVLRDLITMPGVVEWEYWDNAPKPVEITEEEWKERGEIIARVCAEGNCMEASEIYFDATGLNSSLPASLEEGTGVFSDEKFRNWFLAQEANLHP